MEGLTPRELIDQLADGMDEGKGKPILVVDGFDAALLGYVEMFGKEPVALYDRDLCIKILMDRDGMDEDEAEEFFSFNVIGAFVGPYTPAFATLGKKEST